MEKYYESIQGICLLKQLYLEPEIIKRIRYFCNFSVDISGYKNRELVRFLTKDNKERYVLLTTKHRRELIRMMYNQNIHIQPRKESHKISDSRFGSVLTKLISNIEISGYIVNNVISFIPKYPVGMIKRKCKLKVNEEFRYYNYTIYILDIRNTKVVMEVKKHYHNYDIITIVSYNILDFLFLLIHSERNEPLHIFKHMYYTPLKLGAANVWSFHTVYILVLQYRCSIADKLP